MRTCAGIALASALLAGCSSTGTVTNEQTGTVLGAVVGGVLGHQIGSGSGRTAATIVGALAGGAVGHNIGRTMDNNDRMRTAQVLEFAPTGAPTYWRNPDTGSEYTVMPTRTYNAPEGPCREYTMDAIVGGRPEKVYGTACRQSDGSWRTQQ